MTLSKTVSFALVNKALIIVVGVIFIVCDSVADSGADPRYQGTGGRPVIIGDKPNSQVVSTVWQDKFSFVRLEQTEGAVVNSHPVTLAQEQIQAALGQLQVRSPRSGQPEPLLSDKAVDRVAVPIAQALSLAKPDQDVVFAVTDNKRPLPLFSEELATAGRLFYKNGELNVIFGVVNGEFEDQFRATGYIRPFATGSRDTQQEKRWEILPAQGMRYASVDRKDWLLVDPIASKQSQEVTAIESQPSVNAVPAKKTAPPPSSESSTRTATARPPAAASRTTSGEADAHYQKFEERLNTLRRLRENGLITDEEYQNKRSAILDEI